MLGSSLPANPAAPNSFDAGDAGSAGQGQVSSSFCGISTPPASGASASIKSCSPVQPGANYPHHQPLQLPTLRINDVAVQFSRQYYTILSRETDKVHFFYSKQSYSQHGSEGDQETPLCFGLEEIHQRLNSMGYSGCRVFISNVDCQPSYNGGIVLMVLGRVQLKSGPAKRFVQTIFLAEQPSGYFVLNDIFRFIDIEDPLPVVESPSALYCTPPLSPPCSRPVNESAKEPPSSDSARAGPLRLNEAEAEAETQKAPNVSPSAAPAASKHSEAAQTQKERQGQRGGGLSSWAQLAASQDANKWKSGIIAAQSKGLSISAAKSPSNDVGAKASSSSHKPTWKPKFNPEASVFVGNLRIAQRPSEEGIRDVFQSYGCIKSIDWGNNCAYVEFTSVESAQAALGKTVNILGVETKVLMRRVIYPHQRCHNLAGNEPKAASADAASAPRSGPPRHLSTMKFQVSQSRP